MRLGHMSENFKVILSKRELLDNHKVANLEFWEHCVIEKQKRHKSEVFDKFKHWKILIENQNGRKIKRLYTDNGLKFYPREFNDFCRDEGIARHYTVRYTLQLNRSPATAIDNKTPIEFWSGKPVDYSKLCIFGCPAYYHVSEGKLDPIGEKGIFMGYGDRVKGYRIWSPSERRFNLSQDVTFDEDYLFRVKQDPIESKLEDGVSEKVEDVPKHAEHVVLGDMDHDAITSKESDMWSADMGKEIESLHKNNTWELVKLPNIRKVVGCKWCFKMKNGLPGSNIIRFKARLVAKGYSQKEGIDYNEIFSPWAPPGSLIRLLLYVDDMLVVAKDIEEVNKSKILLNTKFDMKDLGASQKILGKDIIRHQNHGKLFLLQKSYIEKIISHFGMSLAKSVNTPSSTSFHLSTTCAPQTEVEIKYMSRIPYASVVGSLITLECGETHFRYLKGTYDVGLIYSGEREYLVAGYSKSDYVADLNARRSLTGYVFTIGNLIVSWKATLQPLIALSTTKAEYMALAEAAKEEI
ncbi:retrovirus-related pol polyprotein from transposon TNT 1-94 [Tanacetum coccineum]|uniref:Retrovirus-related pol polyprotein from transposon TNT 1-94 n=1 Tax=Tanacetum coccineum TaxID=301880 RepID=A0ABQ5FF70_9ASTR